MTDQALGHDYQETARKSASCEAEGSVTYTCSRCGDSYTVEIPGMPAGPVSVTGTFAIPVYEITAVNPDYEATGCDISVDSESEAGFSVSVFVTVMPEREMTDLTVKGNETDTDYSGSLTLSKHNEGSALYIYKFTMPNEPVTVTGRFAVKNYTIAADENMPGSLVLNVNSVQQTLPCMAAADDKVDLSLHSTQTLYSPCAEIPVYDKRHVKDYISQFHPPGQRHVHGFVQHAGLRRDDLCGNRKEFGSHH